LHGTSKIQKIIGKLGILGGKIYQQKILLMFTKIFTYLENKLPVYDEADRVKWDLFISILILIAVVIGWNKNIYSIVSELQTDSPFKKYPYTDEDRSSLQLQVEDAERIHASVQKGVW